MRKKINVLLFEILTRWFDENKNICSIDKVSMKNTDHLKAP